jgi:hypothetical protein
MEWWIRRGRGGEFKDQNECWPNVPVQSSEFLSKNKWICALQTISTDETFQIWVDSSTITEIFSCQHKISCEFFVVENPIPAVWIITNLIFGSLPIASQNRFEDVWKFVSVVFGWLVSTFHRSFLDCSMQGSARNDINMEIYRLLGLLKNFQVCFSTVLIENEFKRSSLVWQNFTKV